MGDLRLGDLKPTVDVVGGGRDVAGGFGRRPCEHPLRTPAVANPPPRILRADAVHELTVHHRNHDHDVIRTAIRSGNADIARVAMESHIVSTVAIFDSGPDDGGG